MLHVHRSDRADGLIMALQALLAGPPDDPFAPEIISVPTRGMERWLTQRLSNGLGICANVEFPFPHRLTGDAVAAASRIDPDADPWLPERPAWPLLEVLEDSLGEPWLATLAAHLAVDRSRRFAAVRHLAGLFDRYALHRPGLIRAWSAGEDEHWQAHRGDGCARASPSRTPSRALRRHARGCGASRARSRCPSASACSASPGSPPAWRSSTRSPRTARSTCSC